MFEICVISASGRSTLLKRDTLIDARETAREAVSVTGHEVEIVDRQTGDVVERHEPPKLSELGCLSGRDGAEAEDAGQRAAQAQELRRKAALARKAASIPTSGSGRVDRVLIMLAERLELEASVLEQDQEVAPADLGELRGG